MSSKTVADKIKQIASVLDGDPSKVTNKSDKATMNQIPKSDVAELISWFESRYDPKNQVVYDSSGNITKENIKKITDIGVDYVSSGALTHSAPILDISLKNLHEI